MGNVLHGGFGCGDDEHMEPFQDTGGEVHVLIVCCSYLYYPGGELTAKHDGLAMESICQMAECENVTTMYDDDETSSPMFPTKENVRARMKEVAGRCKPGDFFLFFYAGHGDTVKDHPPLDEDDGMDEAMVLPGPDKTIDSSFYFIDDDLCATLDGVIPDDVTLLIITDCCHSGTIADVESYKWNHKVVALGACQDHEESADLGSGGLLTKSLQNVLQDLALNRGSKEFSMKAVWKRLQKYCKQFVGEDQTMNMQYANCSPDQVPWPLPRPWWKTLQKQANL